ncbi:hypothetical protein [Modestobacter sp. SSW1-42]
MASPSTGGNDDGPGRIPKNRARVLIIGTFVLIIAVIFLFMILVGTNM